jgi:hypothetical protein
MGSEIVYDIYIALVKGMVAYVEFRGMPTVSAFFLKHFSPTSSMGVLARYSNIDYVFHRVCDPFSINYTIIVW